MEKHDCTYFLPRLGLNAACELSMADEHAGRYVFLSLCWRLSHVEKNRRAVEVGDTEVRAGNTFRVGENKNGKKDRDRTACQL